MTTITIPKKLTKGEELIIIPREEYQEYRRWRKAMSVHRIFKPTETELKDLKESREEYRRGKTMTLHELKEKLGFKS